MPVHLSNEGAAYRVSNANTPAESNCINIGLVNNMAGSALEATERQFCSLLEEAAGDLHINVSLYSLPEVPRASEAQRRVRQVYYKLHALCDTKLDGLIVTGTEPRAKSLSSEPFWEEFRRLCDWADRNTHSTIWSCLAAHAAVQCADGIERLPLAEKLFGLFECTKVLDCGPRSCLLNGVTERFITPHSRWNDIPEEALQASGYDVLSRSPDAGVNAFAKQRKSLFLFFQGHPEYGAETLFSEFRRDVRRYLRGQLEKCPSPPRGCLSPRLLDDPATCYASGDRGCDDNALSECRVSDRITAESSWRSMSVCLYRNWLDYIRTEKASRARCVARSSAALTCRNGRTPTPTQSDEFEGNRVQVEPMYAGDLREITTFLLKSQRKQTDRPISEPSDIRGNDTVESRLKWLLISNPFAIEREPIGYCAKDQQGVIRGLTLCFPHDFVRDDRRIRALCSGSFFVEPSARSIGFFLFRKYLKTAGYSFFYATTCNQNSERVWCMLGGQPIPRSEIELIVPFRLDVIMQALVTRKTTNRLASKLAHLAGQCANPVLRYGRRSPPAISVEESNDYEKMAALSQRHRPGGLLTTDRSIEYLQWRYGVQSPVHPCERFLIRDGQGNEAWFVLTHVDRGIARGPLLLDVVWPRNRMSPETILRAILNVSAGHADALFLRRRAGFDYHEHFPRVITHRLDARALVICPKTGTINSLESLDYDDNDSIAWMFGQAAADRRDRIELTDAA